MLEDVILFFNQVKKMMVLVGVSGEPSVSLSLSLFSVLSILLLFVVLLTDYSFCAYSQNPIAGSNSTGVESGKCPVVQGESGVCSDLSSLGNCYDGGYFCKIDANGLCHCEST